MNESWAIGTLGKHPRDAIKIAADLVTAGLRQGYTSPNDIPDYELVCPNVTGSVFKHILPKAGFVKTYEPMASIGKQKHGRVVFKWVLKDVAKAQAFINEIKAFLQLPRDDKPQMELGI